MLLYLALKTKMLNRKKLSENVVNQIKSFAFYDLTQEQQLLIDKLISDQELKERYKNYGLCQECQQLNTGIDWCQTCNAKHFQEEFKNWSSNNDDIDEFILSHQFEATNSNEVLEWIPYKQFTEIEYLAEGGFSKVYKAKWTSGRIEYWDVENNYWKRTKTHPDWTIALKILNDSQNMATDLLQEITYHKLFSSNQIVKCHGISQETKTKNYVIVVNYMRDGNLRQCLKNNHKKLSFRNKFFQLQTIIKGLNSIHEKKLVHRDLHVGNILNKIISGNVLCYIADLGLCRPVSEKDNKSVYGVLPYVAPEVLRNKGYNQASDIYSFGIIASEIISGFPPYYDLPHDEFLALKICQGLRPKFMIRVPQLLEDLIKQCWDANPLNRPTASELDKILSDWHWNIGDENDTEFYRQVKEVAKVNELFSESPVYKVHSQAIYTSRLLDFKNLPEPQNSQEINKLFYKLTEEMENLRITDPIKFNEELVKRFSNPQIGKEEKVKKEQTSTQIQILPK